MKKLLILITIVFAGQLGMAQQKATDLDKSPMDVSYLPANYPILKIKGQASGEPLARIIYSRPQKKGRTIFGDEVKYNEVWRLGANEATEIEFFKNATVGNKRVPKGRYTVYCIPTEKKWTLIFNKDNYTWGSFNYKSDKDVVRVDAPVQQTSEPVEALTIYFDDNNLSILWDTAKVQLPVSF